MHYSMGTTLKISPSMIRRSTTFAFGDFLIFEANIPDVGRYVCVSGMQG